MYNAIGRRAARWALLGLAILAAGAAPADDGVPGPFTICVLSPAPGEPAVDRVEVVVAVDGPASAEPLTVELVIDGTLAHSWAAPPYTVTHDFGVTGKKRRLVVRALTAEGVLGEVTFETPAIRIDELVDLELQQVYVTVTDRKGERVSGLRPGDFTLRDSDVRQEVVTFGVGEIPFTAILLLDSSLSMKGRRLEVAQAAARRFVSGMRQLDRAQVLSFSDRLLRATAVGTRRVIAGALEEPLEASGGTAARDHLLLATRLLESRQGRRAIILLSDGWDQVSVVATSDLEAAVRRSQSVLYWVRLAGDEPTSFHMRSGSSAAVGGFFAIRYNPAPTSWSTGTKAREDYRALEGLVASTGGRIVVAETASGLEGAVADVLKELHEQYALGYYPSPEVSEGSWHPVSVKLGRRALEVRARDGYVDR